MTKKPWGGRFRAGMDKLMLEFSESVSFDWRLFESDLLGSMAHARTLGHSKIIKPAEARRLIRALGEIERELREEAKSGRPRLRMDLEDIHMNVEHRLRQKVGALAGKLHTGRSRNDQVALDLRLYFRARADESRSLLLELCRALVARAEEHQTAVMAGMTHTRAAQPVLFAHHLLAYVEMFGRDAERFSDCRGRMNLCPLGAGALAGTAFPLDRSLAARELGFDGITQNSIDAVADRDFLLEFGATAAMTMIHLSRLMEELVWWGLPQLGFVELDESFCTGSSMMPNKKNPDAAELVRGKAGRVIGALVALLTVIKATPLSYNRDFQEDKEGMFDAATTLAACLRITERIVATMIVHPERMREAAGSGFALATELADYLAGKGLPFREAHEVVGKLVRDCEERGKRLEDLGPAELKAASPLFGRDARQWLSLEAALKRRNVPGGTAPAQVQKQIRRWKKLLAMTAAGNQGQR